MRGFDDVRGLDDDGVRALLAANDPVERVWAIWALALRAGAAEVIAQTAGEPNGGVRRALAVVLAGHGELDLLVALARHDPDEHVRATAMSLVVRQCEARRVPWAVIEDALARDGAAVRTAIVARVTADAPASVREKIAPLLEDGDRALRLETFEALVRLREGDAAIRAWLDREAGDRGLALQRWLRLDDQSRIAATLIGASLDVRIAALDRFQALPWAEVGPLVADEPTLLFRYRFDLTELPLQLLIDAAVLDDHVTGLFDEIGRRLELGERGERLDAFAAACQERIDGLLAWEAEPFEYDEDRPDPAPRLALERIRELARQALSTSF